MKRAPTAKPTVPSPFWRSLTLLGWFAVGSLAAQQQAPIFRSRSAIIRTDVVVLDNRTGRPISGLTAADFSVREDGVPRDIVTFVAEDGLARAAAPLPQTRRVFLIVLGNGRLDGPVNPYTGLAAFVRTKLRSNDLVGLIAWNRVTALTTDHEIVAKAVGRLRSVPGALFSALLDDRNHGGAISERTQAEIDALFAPTERFPLRFGPAMLLGSDEFRQNPAHWGRWNTLFILRDKLKLLAGIEHLRRVEGERHIIYMSREGMGFPVRLRNEARGLLVQTADEDARMATIAMGANVILNIIHTFGTATKTDAGFQSSQGLAHLTGGQFTSLRTADEQLARIDEASANGYIVGYAPTNPDMDGKYRKTDISVKRRDVTLVYRRGYVARKDTSTADERTLLTQARFEDAAAAGIDVHDIGVTARGIVKSAGTQRVAEIDISISPAGLLLEKRNAEWTGSIDLMIFCGDRDRRVIGTLDQRMTLGMTADMYQRALKSGIPYTARVPLKGPADSARVMVYDYASDRLGSVSITLR